MTEILHGDTRVPGVGKMKRAYIFIPAGIAAVYVGYRWWGSSHSSADPQATDGIYTSPDQSEMGLSTSGGAYNPSGNAGDTTVDATNPNVINTNAEWTQRAVELLSESGYNAMTVYGALGNFLARRSLDKNEALIARSALGAVGQPPVGGPYSVIEEATTGGNGTLAAPSFLRSAGRPTATKVPLQWDRVHGATGYRIYRGTGENIGHSIDTKFTATGLQPDHSYTFSVAALNASGKPGARSHHYTARTTKK